MAESKSSKQALFSWSFYDFANSSNSAIVETFVLPAYFVQAIAANPTQGTEAWGLTLGLSSLLIALAGPIFGAIGDFSGGRKAWLLFFVLLNVGSVAALWGIRPHAGQAYYALILFFFATLGSEFAYIFYNAMLPDLAPKGQIGLWSGWGWAFGYLGGILSLAAALAFEVREAFLLCAAWHAFFSLPIFFWTPPDPARTPILKAIPKGLRQLRNSFSLIFSSYRSLFRFFMARMFFIDGLLTIFSFGGIYAASTFDMSEKTILLFGISLNIAAGIGAFLFAFFDDRLGSLRIMILSLAALILGSALTLLAQSPSQFWISALFLGLFVGPVQASSRAYLAKIAPKEIMNQMFGFFSFSGKATSFLGPLSISLILSLTGSLSLALSIIILFFFIGLLLLLSIKKA